MLLLILLLIINMKKNMKFDKFDKRTATERLQLYEDALGACELLRRIRESQYVYLFLDQSALMKISMVTHFKRVEIEEPRQLFLICEDIDTILQRIADVGDVELPLDDKTRYEKISIGLSYLLFLLHMLEDNVSPDMLTKFFQLCRIHCIHPSVISYYACHSFVLLFTTVIRVFNSSGVSEFNNLVIGVISSLAKFNNLLLYSTCCSYGKMSI